MPKCLLVFPSKGIGGVEVLFWRIGKILNDRGWGIVIGDYSDGTITKFLRDDHIPFEHIKMNSYLKTEDSISLSSDDVIIVCTRDMFEFKETYYKGNPKILIWEVHKGVWMWWGRDKFPTYLWRRAMGLCINKNALIVLENDSLNEIKRAGFIWKVTPSIVPLPVGEIALCSKKCKLDKIRIASVARADPEKIIPLIWAWPKLKQKLGNKVSLVFITDDVVKAKSIMNENGSSAEDIEIIEGLRGASLTKYLDANADIYIGMGTSLLEAGKIAIPSIIIDGAKAGYPDDAHVRLLHLNNLNNLGSPSPLTSGGLLLNQAIEEIILNYEDVSMKTMNYINRCHSSDSVGDALHFAIAKTTLNSKEWRGSIYVRWFSFWRGLRRRIRSVVNVFKLIRLKYSS